MLYKTIPQNQKGFPIQAKPFSISDAVGSDLSYFVPVFFWIPALPECLACPCFGFDAAFLWWTGFLLDSVARAEGVVGTVSCIISGSRRSVALEGTAEKMRTKATIAAKEK
jgi:hypothetical protein